MIYVYNTLTKKKETFVPLSNNVVKMYACGITVSRDAHIGHAVQAMVYDIIRKYLVKKGFKVSYARNYTDVDDKIISRAKELNMEPMDYAQLMMKKTDAEMTALAIDKADYELRATDHIPHIIEFTKGLIKKGYAYPDGLGNVYFAVEKFADYGKLSNRNLEDAYNGVRIDNDENKKSPLDFAVWKAAKDGEISWDSPWGKGRPGWHIECSAMNHSCFGEQIDIHGGGKDLIFPHHENEIAQTQALTGKPFAKYWLHNGLVKVNGQKMSKSLNNSIKIEDVLTLYNVEAIRFALLQTNYKNDINITDNLFLDAEKHLMSFYSTLNKIEQLNIKSNKINQLIDEQFDKCMDNDFNTAEAIANLFGIFKSMNNKLITDDQSVIEDYNAVKVVYSLLGLFKTNSTDYLEYYNSKNLPQSIPANIEELASKRLLAKQNKNYILADELRVQVENLGYKIVDDKTGYTIVKS